MKIIFIILLIMNVVYVIGRQLYPNDENTTRASMFNPEKIVLLPIDEKCMEWGSFYEEQVYYAETILSEMVSDQSYELAEAGSTMMYWLYIPPLPNKEAANRVINKLRNLGIVSFRVKENGEWRNAISLNMLNDKEDALKQLKEIEKKGITSATIENRSVKLKKIVIHNPTQMIKEQMQKLAEQFDGTQLVQSTCERL